MDNIIKNIEYFNFSGIKGALVKRDDIKSITVNILIKAGNVYDDIEKSGTSALTSALLDKGIKGLTAMEIAEEFDYMGSDFTVSPGRDSTIIQLWTLKENFTKSMKLFKRLILEPTFPKEEIVREKEKALSALYQKLDSPSELSSYIFEKHIFGNHPYGNLPTPKSVDNIEREDIVSFYNKYYTRDNLFIVFAGDLSLTEIEKELKDFESHQSSMLDIKKVPFVYDTDKNRVILFNKPDAMQTQIRYGFSSIKRGISYYESLIIANYILGGGGFSSRLLLKVRSEAGLTYSINSSVNASLFGGNFLISGSTKHETCFKAIELSEQVLNDFIEKNVSEKEINDAISFYTGNIPLSLETPTDIAKKILASELYSLGKDYIKKEIENIKKVKIKDINLVSHKYLKKDKKLIVILGNYDKLKGFLNKFKELEIIDNIF